MFEYRGVLHVHSTHSDGAGDPAAVVRDAARAGLDFLAFTEHDNLAPRLAPGEGWHDGVLVIVGGEISPDNNHYLCFGVQSIPSREHPPERYVEEVRRQGGFGFAAHPFDRGNPAIRLPSYAWTAGDGWDGLEVWNLSSEFTGQARRGWNLLWGTLFPGYYLREPDPRNLLCWDQAGRRRPVPAVAGADAHGFRSVLGRMPSAILNYRKMFETLQTRVLLDRPLGGRGGEDVERVLRALRHGKSFMCNAALGDPAGFRFAAEFGGPGRDGDGDLGMGDEARLSELPGPVQLRAAIRAGVPVQAEMEILRDGEAIAGGNGTAVTCPVDRPGVYRAVAYRRGLFGRQVWVLSNAIYLR